MLLLVDTLCQRFRRVVVIDLDHQLEEDRSAIVLASDEVHRDRGVGDFAALECCHDRFVNMMSIKPRSAEFWQWPRMDVDHCLGVEPSCGIESNN